MGANRVFDNFKSLLVVLKNEDTMANEWIQNNDGASPYNIAFYGLVLKRRERTEGPKDVRDDKWLLPAVAFTFSSTESCVSLVTATVKKRLWAKSQDNAIKQETMSIPPASNSEAKRDASSNLLESRAPRARALRRLRHHIESGQIHNGDVLPPERVLCATLEISRGTLRRVLEALENEGLVRQTNGGKTRIVSDRPIRESAMKPQGDAIAIISPNTREAMKGHRQSGWADFIALGALREIQQTGMNAITIGGGSLTEKDLNWVLRWRPYGLIIPELVSVEDSYGELLERVVKAGVRTVVYSGAEDMASFDRVSSDHDLGAYELTRWFLARGRRRIAMAWSQQDTLSYWHAARKRGYERAMREANLEPIPPIEFLPYNFEGETKKIFEARAHYFAGYFARAFSRPEPVDAILAETDGLLPAMATACQILGREPNKDVWFAGYDNYWADSPEQTWKQFTPMVTMDKQNWEIGQELVRLLVNRVQGKLPPEPQWLLVPPKLIETANLTPEDQLSRDLRG